VICHAASFAIGLVKAISSSTLALIHVDLYCFGQSRYQDLINVLLGCCSQLSLTSISISRELGNESIPTSVDVKPLFIFSALTTVKLVDTNAQFQLDNTSLKDMALAWPHITFLVF